MFKSAGSHAGPLKRLRRASRSPRQMHAKPSLGKYAAALLHSPDCMLNFQLSPIEPGNQMAQTSTERKPPRHTNTAFASVPRNWGCCRKRSYISLKALTSIMSLLIIKNKPHGSKTHICLYKTPWNNLLSCTFFTESPLRFMAINGHAAPGILLWCLVFTSGKHGNPSALAQIFLNYFCLP